MNTKRAEHHPFCNYFLKEIPKGSTCENCEYMWEEYGDDTPKNMVKKHFPNAINRATGKRAKDM